MPVLKVAQIIEPLPPWEPPVFHRREEQVVDEIRAIDHGYLLVRVEDGRPQTIQRVEFEEKPRPLAG